MKPSLNQPAATTSRGARAAFTIILLAIALARAVAQDGSPPGAGGAAPATSSRPCNQLFGGVSTIFEGGSPRFNTFGVNGAFTYPVSNQFGLTADAGLHFGSNQGVSLTKTQLLVGASYFPAFNQQGGVAVVPHLLAGVASIGSSYSYGDYTWSDHTSYVAAAAGASVAIPIAGLPMIVVGVDYIPTFSSAGISHNVRVGAGVAFTVGCNDEGGGGQPPLANAAEPPVACKASSQTEELKISLAAVNEAVKSLETVLNGIPRVEAKVQVKGQITVKRGEECCSKDKPPVVYTELKGGVEGSCTVNINLWGIPDINYSVKLWPVLVIAELKCKLFTGPQGKANIDGVGKYYGALGSHDRPDCPPCWYLIYKFEGFLRVGVTVGGKIALYHWSPLAKGEAGFDLEEPDEVIEASAEASASIGATGQGTYAVNDDCKKPPKGLHGEAKIGKAKANVKVNITIGPLAFDPSFEVNLFDGFTLAF